MLNLCSVLL